MHTLIKLESNHGFYITAIGGYQYAICCSGKLIPTAIVFHKSIGEAMCVILNARENT